MPGISDSVQKRGNTDQRKNVFWDILRSVLLNIFSHNLDLRENISFVTTRIDELFNCAKIKVAKINRAKIRGARNLIGLRCFNIYNFCFSCSNFLPVYVCMGHVCAYMCVYMCVYSCMCVYAFMFACRYVCVWTHLLSYIYACIIFFFRPIVRNLKLC